MAKFSGVSAEQLKILRKLMQGNSPQTIIYALKEIERDLNADYEREAIPELFMEIMRNFDNLKEKLSLRDLHTIHGRLFRLNAYIDERANPRPLVMASEFEPYEEKVGDIYPVEIEDSRPRKLKN